MNANSIDLAIRDIITKTMDRDKPNQESLDYLLAQGDVAVPYIVSGIEEYEGPCC